jgi:integrase
LFFNQQVYQPMPTKHLNERTIDALTPKAGKQYVTWDVTLKGFGVRVSPAGTKTFVYAYRTPGGRSRWKTLGRAGTVSLDRARRLAKGDAGIVASGADPLKQTDAARGAIVLRDVAERWMADAILPRRKPTTARNYRQALDAYILPLLGNVPMADVSQADAVRLHESMRKTPTQANRILAALSSLLGWSMKGNGRYRPIGPNPCVGIEKFGEQKRSRYLTAAEYARVGAALRKATIAPGIRTAIELLLLTGARPVEIAGLQWTAVDLPQAALRLADSKTGAKVIHLSPRAVSLLKRWPRHAHSPYCFPGTGHRDRGAHLHPSTLSHTWADLRATIDLKDVRLYDARHSYASVGASSHGLSLPQIGAQLGHSQPATTARYAHLHESVAKQHAEQIGGTIAASLRRRVRR